MMDEALCLLLFGKPQVSRNGAPVTGFIYNKALALLAYLAVTRRPHSRDALAGLFWGDMSEVHAKANLRKILAVLRDVAGPSLTIDRQTAAFNLAAPYWLDTEAFESKLQSVLATSMAPAALSDRDAKLLTEAVQLHRGEFLEGFYVRDAPSFEEWVLAERERLRQIALQALYRLAAFHTARGHYATGIDYTSQLLAMEPWHEEVHQQMMLLLALSGQRSAAIRQYQSCRQVLAQEFGSQPNADTVALYKRIRSGEIGRPPDSETYTAVLPPDVTPFIGRREELAALTGYFTRPDCRLVTLVGLSGVGKTRMALQAAAQLMPLMKHGACFVPFAEVQSGDHIYAALASALGLTPDPRREARVRVVEHLRERETLLVLDQFEHLRDSSALLAGLLQGAPNVKLLVTSLERLNLRSEWSMPLAGLRVPALGTEPEPAGSDSVRLFAEIAARHRPDFALTSENLPSVIRICHLVDGMPLGIELASAWTRVLTCTQIVSELERDYRFLASTAGDAPQRHRSLQVALNQSWSRLSDAEREAFRRLSVFEGGFTREAAQEVASASLGLLASIVDKGLVASNPFGRYYLHQLLKQFGKSKLEESPDLAEATRSRHSGYYKTFLKTMMERLSGPWQEDAVNAIASEQENLRAAWQWESGNKAPSIKVAEEQKTP